MIVTFEVFLQVKRAKDQSDEEYLKLATANSAVLTFSMSSDDLSPLLLRLKDSQLVFDDVLVGLLGGYEIHQSDPDQLPKEHLVTCVCDKPKELREALVRLPYVRIHP